MAHHMSQTAVADVFRQHLIIELRQSAVEVDKQYRMTLSRQLDVILAELSKLCATRPEASLEGNLSTLGPLKKDFDAQGDFKWLNYVEPISNSIQRIKEDAKQVGPPQRLT